MHQQNYHDSTRIDQERPPHIIQLENRLFTLVNEEIMRFLDRRYPRGPLYVYSEEGFIEPRGFTEDLFKFQAANGPGVCYGGDYYEETIEVASYTDSVFDDHIRLTTKDKIQSFEEYGVDPVADYVVQVELRRVVVKSKKRRNSRQKDSFVERWTGAMSVVRIDRFGFITSNGGIRVSFPL